MDREIDLSKLGFSAGDKVILVDDNWSNGGHDLTLVELEPVPGSTQCLVKEGDELRTVNRLALRPA